MKTADSITVDSLRSPLFIAWQINAECNLGCLHCCEEAGHHMSDTMTKSQAFDLCRQIADANIPYVALSGGEPLLHPFFFEICEFFSKHNISLKVETNGEFIDELTARRFARLRLRSVQVSLDGAAPASHERLRLNGNWQKAVEACRLLIKESVNTEIVFVPTGFNIAEIGGVIDLACSLGAYGLYTGKMMRIGRAALNWDTLCPTDEQYEEFFRVLREKTKEYAGRMKIYFYQYDVIEELKYRSGYPAASLLVLPNGKVKLIGPLPFICGDVRKEPLLQVWENYRKAWTKTAVQEFVRRVVQNHELLAESNKWCDV